MQWIENELTSLQLFMSITNNLTTSNSWNGSLLDRDNIERTTCVEVLQDVALSRFPTLSYVTFALVFYDPDTISLQHSPIIALSTSENSLLFISQ